MLENFILQSMDVSIITLILYLGIIGAPIFFIGRYLKNKYSEKTKREKLEKKFEAY